MPRRKKAKPLECTVRLERTGQYHDAGGELLRIVHQCRGWRALWLRVAMQMSDVAGGRTLELLQNDWVEITDEMLVVLIPSVAQRNVFLHGTEEEFYALAG